MSETFPHPERVEDAGGDATGSIAVPCPVCGAAPGQDCTPAAVSFSIDVPPDLDPGPDVLLAPEDRQAMIEAEVQARIEHGRQRAFTDQAEAWRLQLVEAAGDEGLDVVWLDEPHALAARIPGRGHPVLAPAEAIDAQRDAGVPADAVAAMIKAVALDPRLAWWGDDDDPE